MNGGNLAAGAAEKICFGPLRAVYLIFAGLAVLSISIGAFGQRKPSEPARPFVVMSAQSLDDLQKIR